MTIKGLLKICQGIFSDGILTFEDSQVTPAVSLQDLVNSGDPFSDALFDLCTPLFDCDSAGNVDLLEECG